MSRRTHRVQDLLRAELTDLLLRDIRDPRFEGVSVVGVDVSADLSNARVRVSVLADDEERAQVQEALDHAAGYFKVRLAKRLRHMRRVPTLSFQIDRGAEHSQRINDLLENLR